MKYKIKNLIQIGLLLIALILIFSLLKNISKLAGSNQKIVDAGKTVDNLKKENSNLTKELQSAKTIQFVEKQARDKLGLAKVGETVVVLPPPEILKTYAPKLEEENVTLPDPNWKRWLKLFL